MPSPLTAPHSSGFIARLLSMPDDTTPGSHRWCVKLFWGWLAFRTVAWVAFTSVAFANPPLDLIEWLSWGHSLQWGYPKHPPLPAWLAAGFARLSPGDVWGVYILAYLTVGACMWAAWRLALEYVPPPQALLAALCLEGSLYFTVDPSEWSNNVALDLGWACIILFAHRAIHTGALRWWAVVGVAVGLTLLCKYTIGVLLIPLTAYLVLDPQARKHFRTPGPYLAAAIALLVFAPHLVWLVENNFITVTYAGERSGDPRPFARVWNPTEFLLGQAYHVLPMLVILYPALGHRGEAVRGDRFLHAVVMGPVVLLLAISLATGSMLREIWGSPLWTFLGVWVLTTFRGTPGSITHGSVLVRVGVVTGLMLVFALAKAELRPYADGHAARQQYPGRELADELNRRWGREFAEPFPIVAGEAWAAGNVCCFSPHRPVLYSSGIMGDLVFEPRATPWTNDDDLNARGGVVVWDALKEGDEVPHFVRERLPRVVGTRPIELPYHGLVGVPNARIGVAFVPPAGK